MTTKKNKTILIILAVIVILLAIISIIGIFLYKNEPEVLQGQIEATEITISGKLLGRIDKFLVKEGQQVRKGDTLVIINSPEVDAQLEQATAMENVARYQNQKVDAGTREQLINALKQAWIAAKADRDLARKTYERVERLYKDSVATAQKRDEAYALYQSAQAAEKAAYNQYQLAFTGAQKEDKESARALVNAARGTVNAVQALLTDSRLTAPESGEIAAIYPTVGELVMPGAAIMNLVVLTDSHVVLNVREDQLPFFYMGGQFRGKVPALGNEEVNFNVSYISPLGSFATWRSTKQTGSYDVATFQIKAYPTDHIDGLRPGMSVLVTLYK